ncbi:MAG: hydrogenase maturation nickel metallochaperone HypA [Chloroflexi bacterium]|nr:hydrogenase maturation nickel metallochaperone HypA [Chloroflexota bacterium]MCL5110661.1 hydrogenase maturation nickel metallochaperone HypA [Chloroflexota bacterium]
MHELSITESLLKIALAAGEKGGAVRITSIRIVVGDLTQVDPESVQFYLDVLAKGTIAEGALLAAERRPLRAACRDCGREFGVAEFQFVCPHCNSGDTAIVSGRELYIDSIEVEGTEDLACGT